MAGTPKWWDVQVTPIVGADGQPERLLSVSRDITATKQAEELQRLLMQELSHRVKNTLSMVQAIFSQTFRGDKSLSDMRAAFSSRLVALSHAHDLLMQGSWDAANLQGLIDGAARLHGSDVAGRFDVEGPDVTLGAQAALSFALILHELTTNAVKYGAFSVRNGTVKINWHEAEVDGEPHLHFVWREVGGPIVSSPDHHGFGSRLIQRSFAKALEATVQLSYPPEGVVLTLDAPLAGLRQHE